MSKYSELIYMVMDELKLSSNDSYFNEDHVLFLLNKHRNYLIEQVYSKSNLPVPSSYYNSVAFDLEVTNTLPDDIGCKNFYLRSKEKVPQLLSVGIPTVSSLDFFSGEITLIPAGRFKYVGHNKYLKNIIYCAKGPDDYLYFKSNNPNHKYLKKVTLRAIFSDPYSLKEEDDSDFDDIAIKRPYNKEFPMEDSLIPELIKSVVSELYNSVYRPEDKVNNGSDDLSGLSVKEPKRK